jgi:hypothetical protein
VFGFLSEAQVDRFCAEGSVLADDVHWTILPSNPNWTQFGGFVDARRETAVRLIMTVSLLRPEKYTLLLLRGEQVLRRLDVRGSHRNPPATSGQEWKVQTHKHAWSDGYADKVAYTPPDVRTMTFARDEYEVIFRAFCRECGVDFQGRWTDPPKPAQTRLDI